ncbi:uncharacterized protein [Antedon mediterranea]|uniref:uncharacterized protein n=1 Tax=Antedon mediterranea TaxID=105859 RepID=UPI003AF80B9F
MNHKEKSLQIFLEQSQRKYYMDKMISVLHHCSLSTEAVNKVHSNHIEYWVALICILVAVFAVYIYGNIKTLFLYFVAIVILVVFIGYLCDKLWKFYTQNRGC